MAKKITSMTNHGNEQILKDKAAKCKQLFDWYKKCGRSPTMQHIEEVYEVFQKLKEKGIANVTWVEINTYPGKSAGVKNSYSYDINDFEQFFNDCWRSYMLRAIERQKLAA